MLWHMRAREVHDRNYTKIHLAGNCAHLLADALHIIKVKVARATLISTRQPRPNALSVIVSLMQWAHLALEAYACIASRLGLGSWEDGHAIAELV